MLKFLRQQRGLIVFLFCILFFRTAIADWNPVPSGSMEPTIFAGDVVLVDKTRLGPALPFSEGRLFSLGEPQRGDIITFRSPVEDTTLIKRVIGVPGDRISSAGLQMLVNGEPLPLQLEAGPDAAGVLRGRETIGDREHGVQFNTRRGVVQLPAEITVPQDAYFVMGDYRNDSVDSRYFGFVPRTNVIGSSRRIAVSIAAERSIGERIGSVLH